MLIGLSGVQILQVARMRERFMRMNSLPVSQECWDVELQGASSAPPVRDTQYATLNRFSGYRFFLMSIVKLPCTPVTGDKGSL